MFFENPTSMEESLTWKHNDQRMVLLTYVEKEEMGRNFLGTKFNIKAKNKRMIFFSFFWLLDLCSRKRKSALATF